MTNENEEERRKFIKRLIESEAETRAEPPLEPRKDEPKDEPDEQAATTKAHIPQRTPPPHIPLDKDNLPLPRRVDEVDMGSTRVTPAAYEPLSRPKNGTSQPTRRVPPPSVSQPVSRPVKINLKQGLGCAARILVLGLFALVIIGIIGGS